MVAVDARSRAIEGGEVHKYLGADQLNPEDFLIGLASWAFCRISANTP